MESVLKFYNSLDGKVNYQEEMHDFAKQKFDWEIQMKKIFDNI